MEAGVVLLLMLFGVCHGAELPCDGRQEGAECYGALGGTVVLRLMDSASQLFKYQWFNTSKEILSGGKNRVVINLMKDRSTFTPSDGTFRINNLSRTDSGNYTLNIFNSNGQRSETRTLQLTVQAPVSSVLLVSECLSQGEMRVSCSSEGGDSPQYSWTLNGHTLTDTQLLSRSKETNNITLRQEGILVCSVSNHVSSVSKEVEISTCGFIFIDCISNGTQISQWVLAANNTLCIDPTTTSPMITTEGKETGNTVSINPSTNNTSSNQDGEDKPWYIKNLPIIAGVLSALVFLLVVVVVVFCTQKKKQNQKQKEEDDEQELTYADVRVFQRQGRQQMPQRAENEVEYGQVKFSEGPRRTVEPAEECVYAKVRRDR